MNYTKEKSIKKLTEYLLEKYNILEDILTITILQTEVIKDEDMDELLMIIDEKQKMIDLINKIDDEFLKEYSKFKSVLGLTNEEDLYTQRISEMSMVKNTTEKILKKVKEIQSHENKNKDKAEELLSSFQEKIKKSNKDIIARLAYGNSSYKKPPSYFIDKKK